MVVDLKRKILFKCVDKKNFNVYLLVFKFDIWKFLYLYVYVFVRLFFNYIIKDYKVSIVGCK